MATEVKPQLRAGCYLRISSDPNDKRNGVARQREDTAVMCEVQGWTVARYYEDNNRSASNGGDRPAWKQLLADIQAGDIDVIVAWNQDRAWRKMADFEELRPALAPLGVLFATTNIGTIDFNNPDDIFRVHVSTSQSEMEIAKMRVRQLRAARQRAERGKPKWREAFGYLPYTGRTEDDRGVRAIDPEVQPLVEEAYKRVLQRHKLREIAAYWNAAGKRGLNGKDWKPSTVSLFLRSPRNAGLRTHNGHPVKDKDGQPVKGTWPPLVDLELWEAAQTVLDAPGRAPGPKTVRQHLLTGIIWCGRVGCGGHLSGNWGPMLGDGTGRVLIYRCKACLKIAVRDNDLQPLVIRALVKRLSRDDAVTLLRKKTYNAAEAKKLRDEEAVLRAKVIELGKNYATAPPEFTAAALADLEGKLDALAARQHDEERKRLLDGIPLGTDKVGDALEAMTPDRLRAIIAALMLVKVKPVGKGHHRVFNRERVDIAWR